MKKRFVLSILLVGILSGPFCLEAQRRSWRERATYEKDVWWTKGLPAAKKKLWDRKPLTQQEQMYFNSLAKRMGGITAVLTLLASVYGGKRLLGIEPGQQKQSAPVWHRENTEVKTQILKEFERRAQEDGEGVVRPVAEVHQMQRKFFPTSPLGAFLEGLKREDSAKYVQYPLTQAPAKFKEWFNRLSDKQQQKFVDSLSNEEEVVWLEKID